MSLSDPLFPQLRTCNNPIVPWFGVQNYRSRYWNEPYFKAIESIRAVADKHGLTMAEIALRWISHHSLLKRAHGDAILIGASSLNHIEQNLVDLEKGPLRESLRQIRPCEVLILLTCLADSGRSRERPRRCVVLGQAVRDELLALSMELWSDL